MAEGGCLFPTLTWLPEKQELTLVETLEMIDGTKRLCRLCPEYQTEVVAVWARCGHCNKPLTRLGPIQQEPQYIMDLQSGLCHLQPTLERESETWTRFKDI